MLTDGRMDWRTDWRTDRRTENRTPISHPATSRCDKNSNIFQVKKKKKKHIWSYERLAYELYICQYLQQSHNFSQCHIQLQYHNFQTAFGVLIYDMFLVDFLHRALWRRSWTLCLKKRKDCAWLIKHKNEFELNSWSILTLHVQLIKLKCNQLGTDYKFLYSTRQLPMEIYAMQFCPAKPESYLNSCFQKQQKVSNTRVIWKVLKLAQYPSSVHGFS